MKVALALLVISFCAVALANREAFIAFQHKYNKYYSAGEFSHRYSIFQENLRRVEKMNEGKESPTYGVTKFFDLSPEEFRAQMLMKKSVKTDHSLNPSKEIDPSTVNVPASFDWRNQNAVTPVYNQGQCGSCWAFSITENIESMWFLAGHSLPSLSMQQVVDCDTSDDGCGGGDPPTAYQYVESTGGLESYSDYPYTAEDGYCNFQKGDVVATISNWAYATQSNNEDNMVAYLVAHGPLSICVDAESWQYYTGGVIMKGDGCGTSLDHCVMATGYATNSAGTPYWNVRNSWGTDWGLNGYLMVERGQNVCGISQEATSSII